MTRKITPKTRVQAAVLHRALKDVGKIVEARSTIPIWTYVVMQARDQQITITGTDGDLWAIRTCASDDRDGPAAKEWLDSIRPFTICLPAKLLESILAELDGAAMVCIEAPAEVDDAWSGRVVVSAGKARFRLHALPVEDFPQPAPFDGDAEFEMPCSQLGDILAGVDHAISSEETRYYLNGVFMHAADLTFRFVTTDGNRLARWALDGPMGSTSFPDVIVSRKTVDVLEKLLAGAVKATKDAQGEPPQVLIEANDAGTRLRFSLDAEGDGQVEVIAKTIDGTFPDYPRVIPQAPPQTATIGRSALAAVVKRVSVLAEAKSRAIKLAFAENCVTVSARSVERGEASEDMDCTYSGPAFEIGFDGSYLRESLAAIASDTVALRFDTDAGSAMRIAGWEDQAEVGSLLQVLMPVRV